LEQVFEKFAQRNDGLFIRRDSLQMAQVFAIESSEDEVAVFFAVTNVTEWSKVSTEMLHR